MSAVVLRCSHCGTVQAEPGECEACHEAQVRYFCTNHSPGLWLDTFACHQCGARFGDPAPSPRESASTPASNPAIVEASPRRRVETEPSPWDTPAAGRASRFEEKPYPTPDPRRIFFDLISAAARRSTAHRGHAESARPGRRRGGCVRTLLVMALLFLALFALLPVLLGMVLGYG